MLDNIKDVLACGLSERGNTALINNETGGAVFFAEITEGEWMEVSMAPDNHPSWNISTFNKTKSEIRTHIEENLNDTWTFQRNNIGANTLNNSPVELEYVMDAVRNKLYNDNPDYATNDTVEVIHAYLESRDWTLDVAGIEMLRHEFDSSM